MSELTVHIWCGCGHISEWFEVSNRDEAVARAIALVNQLPADPCPPRVEIIEALELRVAR